MFRKKEQQVQRPRGGVSLTWSKNSEEMSVSGVEGQHREMRSRQQVSSRAWESVTQGSISHSIVHGTLVLSAQSFGDSASA